MRLDPPGFQRLVQADSFEVRFTGAEANAGVSLVNFGVPTRVVSRVPDNEIGEACLRFIRRHGLDTTFVARGGERLGLFYLETGVAQRPSKVIYDRSGTSFRTPETDRLRLAGDLRGRRLVPFLGDRGRPRATRVKPCSTRR